jgi:hypothetical protein
MASARAVRHGRLVSYLDLDHSRLDASIGQQVLQLLHAEVADANRLAKDEHSHVSIPAMARKLVGHSLQNAAVM